MSNNSLHYDFSYFPNRVIDNLDVFGLANAVRGSKFPMAVDVGNAEYEIDNLNYWMQFDNFIFDFIEYQDKYGKNKGDNTKDSCIFCGSNVGVEKATKYGGNYYCSKCRHQLERYGEVFETTPKYELFDNYVEMTAYGDKRNKKTTKISYQSLPDVFYEQWATNGSKYIKNKNGELMHQFLMKGAIKNGMVVDHINRDIFDNRLHNLRVCTRQENTMNCGLSTNNQSGVTGVSFNKDKNKWRAYINKDSKQINLGTYEKFEDAVKARLIGEQTEFGEFAPQRYLFEQYGIEVCDDSAEDEFKYNLQEAIKSFKRIKRLGNTRTGEAHDQALTGIIAQFDLTFTVKAYTEAERYHFFDFISSQSTMHRISKFDLDNQYIGYVDERMIAIMNELKDKYNETHDEEDYLHLLYSNPCGFKLTAAMTTNYRQLKTIYHQRKNHRLPEWQTFCEQLEQFPYFKELCLNEVDN